MASEEHRTENRVHSQSVYKQPVVVDDHVGISRQEKSRLEVVSKKTTQRDFCDETQL
jgi:hypothetical protein